MNLGSPEDARAEPTRPPGATASTAEERVTIQRARAYLAERAARAKPGALARVLARSGGDAPVPGDELPEGWLGPAPR